MKVLMRSPGIVLGNEMWSWVKINNLWCFMTNQTIMQQNNVETFFEGNQLFFKKHFL